ncbi:MAG: hypothetical protein IJT70_02100 [Clostridia bacterium]|nr:hypothetical protein [Clostridia bacterium]
MAFIDDVKDTLAKTGKTAVRKTKDLAAIAKVTADIEETKSLLKAVYIEIGKKYCETHDKASADEEYVINVATAENLKEQLEALIVERLTLRGKVKCAECGKSVDNAFIYCPFCGKKLPEAPADSAPTEDAADDDVIEVDLDDEKDDE